MEEWSGIWLFKFHPEKCKYMHIRREMEIQRTYEICQTPLQQVTSKKDRGVVTNDKLELEEHTL